MAINYNYDPVVDGITDASADYMNNMQNGIKKACDSVDILYGNINRCDMQSPNNTTILELKVGKIIPLQSASNSNFSIVEGYAVCNVPGWYNLLQQVTTRENTNNQNYHHIYMAHIAGGAEFTPSSIINNNPRAGKGYYNRYNITYTTWLNEGDKIGLGIYVDETVDVSGSIYATRIF